MSDVENKNQNTCLALKLHGEFIKPFNRGLRKQASSLARVEKLRARPIVANRKFKSVYSGKVNSSDRYETGSVRRYKVVGAN